MMRILLVEDDPHKKESILSFIEQELSDFEIDEAYSFNGACKLIETVTYDLALLDMSLPTFDRSARDSGGQFRTFGGREIGRKLVRRRGMTRVVFVTQYSSFSNRGKPVSIESLGETLRNELGPNFLGIVFYDSSKDAWRHDLSSVLETL